MTHPAQTACLPARVLAGLRGRLTSSQGTSPRAFSAWRGRRALPSAGRTDGWGGGYRLLVWTRAERQSTRRGTRSRRHLPGTQHLSTAAPPGSRRHAGRRTQNAGRAAWFEDHSGPFKVYVACGALLLPPRLGHGRAVPPASCLKRTGFCTGSLSHPQRQF